MHIQNNSLWGLVRILPAMKTVSFYNTVLRTASSLVGRLSSRESPQTRGYLPEYDYAGALSVYTALGLDIIVMHIHAIIDETLSIT